MAHLRSHRRLRLRLGCTPSGHDARGLRRYEQRRRELLLLRDRDHREAVARPLLAARADGGCGAGWAPVLVLVSQFAIVMTTQSSINVNMGSAWRGRFLPLAPMAAAGAGRVRRRKVGHAGWPLTV